MTRINCFHSPCQATCSSSSSAEEGELMLYLALKRITFNQLSDFITVTEKYYNSSAMTMIKQHNSCSLVTSKGNLCCD